jgi:hypothetical protein
MKCAIAASFVMNVPIGHKLAAMCFTVMGAYTIFWDIPGISWLPKLQHLAET